MAKISCLELTQRLRTDVPNIFLLAAPLAEQLGDVWPEIDAGLAASIEAMHPNLAQARDDSPSPPEARTFLAVKLGSLELLILDKMERSGRWGHNSISIATLLNHYLHKPRTNEALSALQHLEAADLLVVGNLKDGPLGLNPKMKTVINNALESYRNTLNQEGTPPEPDSP